MSTATIPGAASDALSPSSPFTPIPKLDSTFGAILIGTFASATLQGIILVQTYSYCRHYPNDPRFVKIWVSLVFVMELLITISSMHSCYIELVTNYLNFQALLTTVPWSTKAIPTLGGTVTLTTQLFLARRIYILKRTFRPIALVAILFTVGLFACCIDQMILMQYHQPDSHHVKWVATASSCLVLVADVMLTSTFIWFLRSNRSSISRTNSLLDDFMLYAVSSGLVLCTFNILNVICSLAFPKTLAYTATSLVLTKLYSITFMVWLNAREPLRERGIVMVDTDLFTSVITVNAQYPSEVVVGDSDLPRTSQPTTTSLSLAGLHNLSQSSGDLGRRSVPHGGGEKM